MAYIVFEGGEGTGKSTQLNQLARKLDAITTREPGGTSLGASLRAWLLDAKSGAIDVRAETLMMAADRAQHMSEVVEPALAKGRHVLSDRSVYSSLAYQGRGRGLGIEQVRSLNDWALSGRWPDLVIFLDASPDVTAGRLNRPLDRMEQAGDEFHTAVRDAYREMAEADPLWATVDAAGSIGEVAERVWNAVEKRLAEIGELDSTSSGSGGRLDGEARPRRSRPEPEGRL